MKTPRALCLALLAFLPIRPATASDMFVYFGSHSFGPGIGFSLARFDTETGALTKPAFLIEAREPAFFVLTPDGSRLYTCNSGTPGGLSAYAVEPHTGRLTLINRVLAGGGDTSFITLDRTGRYVLVANYDGGNVAVFALRPDGAIGDWTGFDQHTGRSVNPRRQAHAYAHAIVLDPTNRFVLVPDLGVDRLYIYRFDGNSGALTPNEPAFAAIAPGSGPRHVRFHPNGRWVYLINEIASTIIAFSWDSTNGRLAPFQTITTLPANFKGVSACAELEIHPNGRFLYCSNRGDRQPRGLRDRPGHGPAHARRACLKRGKIATQFRVQIPPDGGEVVTNHDSNNALVFRVDTATGRLTRSGDPVTVPSPYCERFLPVR